MRHRRAPFILGFLILPVVIYAWYVLVPLVQTIFYSFTDWGGFSQDAPDVVGLDNYVELVGDSLVQKAFWHNVFFLVTIPLFTLGLALFLAFLLNVGGRGGKVGIRGVWGSGFYKVVFFIPQVLSVILVAIMWQGIYRGDGDGLLNSLLAKLGLIDDPLAFHQDPTTILGVPQNLFWLLLISVWGSVGFYMVLFSAAMTSIPKDIYEAALLDGASRFASFFKVTLPLLRETISTGWIYLGIAAFDMYGLIVTMTPGPGGPDDSTQVLASVFNFHLNRTGRFGYGCAIAVSMMIIAVLLSMAQMRLTRREKIEY
ncbi:N-acetylglucosamine transport system permease protein [Allocatelliglobosispora scoriae]|uniref:N-acetylglucosamine transport system permease protein n=1 Tax=Allocatelliglobosispora scoriae TaxID=643052 RepID=A0A841BLM0_9ACTN|nr:sugar ABC transporter permease [Allocatelliglobosispora scoriae]MBB5869184.1 N-acetylglucosamine transport system permease protein [Allocatelliglobosispora scoriae]